MVPRGRMISAPTWVRRGFAGEWRWNWCILHGLSRTPAPTNSVLANPVVGVGVLDDPCGTYRMECRSRTNTRFVQSSRRGRRPRRPAQAFEKPFPFYGELAIGNQSLRIRRRTCKKSAHPARVAEGVDPYGADRKCGANAPIPTGQFRLYCAGGASCSPTVSYCRASIVSSLSPQASTAALPPTTQMPESLSSASSSRLKRSRSSRVVWSISLRLRWRSACVRPEK